MDWTWALIVLFVAFLNEAFLCRTVTVSLTPTPITGLHVVGNEIRNKDGKRVIFHGVNRSGLEFSCVHNVGIFDGPSDASSVKVIASWKTNIIRLPLNEDCWLGINGINPQYSGQNYQRAVHNYVKGLNDAGLAVILDLHWTAPGSQQADGQRPMPDQDHSIAFWSSVAEQFKNNSAVLFDLFNEPFPDNGAWNTEEAWTCWRDGGTCRGINYKVAGMQSLVNAVRQTGAQNIMMLGGLQWANSLMQWLKYKPYDPLGTNNPYNLLDERVQKESQGS
jgi:endoglucanase